MDVKTKKLTLYDKLVVTAFVIMMGGGAISKALEANDTDKPEYLMLIEATPSEVPPMLEVETPLTKGAGEYNTPCELRPRI